MSESENGITVHGDGQIIEGLTLLDASYPAAPLGPAVAEAVGQRAKLHIIGGMTVDGKVVEYDETLGVATVRQGEHNYEVDVRSVAVLET